MNPYHVLKLQPDATTEQVTKAYRILSKKYHADRNPGDESAKAKYAEVDAAYRVLIDPERRAVYDRTGDASEPRKGAADPEHAELCQMLQPVLLGILQEIGNQRFGANPKTVDVVAKIKARFAETATNAGKHKDSVERGLKLLRDVVDRFQVKDGENVLQGIVRSQLAQTEAELDRVTRDIEKFARVQKYLEGVSFRIDTMPPDAHMDTLLAAIAPYRWRS
jgi:curved DNA-binding protein CbpA